MAGRHHGGRSHIGPGLRGLQSVRPVRLAVWRKVRTHGYDHASAWDQGIGPVAPRHRPRLCTRSCQRSSQSRRERHQHAVGKSNHWRARDRDADRVSLHSGRPDVPRFWRASSWVIPNLGCRGKPASKGKATGKFVRSSPGNLRVRSPLHRRVSGRRPVAVSALHLLRSNPTLSMAKRRCSTG